METLGETLKRAWQLHQRGEYAQAETLYRQIVDVEAEHNMARFLLGRLELMTVFVLFTPAAWRR